jgi:hypothetical protein
MIDYHIAVAILSEKDVKDFYELPSATFFIHPTLCDLANIGNRARIDEMV